MSNTAKFPTNGGADAPKPDNAPLPPLPALLDVLSGGTKCCPFMGANIVTMPVMAPGSILAPQQQQQIAFVRHFTPCMGAGCAAWDRQAAGCGMVTVRHDHAE